MERQPRPKILIPTIQSLDPLEYAQVTLLADRIPHGGLEGAWVDDREVSAVDHRRPPDVKLAWAVAPLATNRKAPEDRWLIPIDRTSHFLDTISVAEQATSNGPAFRSGGFSSHSPGTGPTARSARTA